MKRQNVIFLKEMILSNWLTPWKVCIISISMLTNLFFSSKLRHLSQFRLTSPKYPMGIDKKKKIEKPFTPKLCFNTPSGIRSVRSKNIFAASNCLQPICFWHTDDDDNNNNNTREHGSPSHIQCHAENTNKHLNYAVTALYISSLRESSDRGLYLPRTGVPLPHQRTNDMERNFPGKL